MRLSFLKKAPTCFIFILILMLCLITACKHDHKRQQTSTTQQRFSDIEKWVNIFEDPERDEWQKPVEVVKAMDLKPGDVVADIGAGTGYFTRHFAVAVSPDGKALGLDIEQSMVKYMREDAQKLHLNNYEAKVIKTDDPELAAHSVDVIFLCNTYHHIENRVEYFRNVSKSLKPNGRIIIVDFYKNSDFGPPRDHKMAKTVVINEMGGAGYELLNDQTVLPEQYYLEFSL